MSSLQHPVCFKGRVPDVLPFYNLHFYPFLGSLNDGILIFQILA